MHRLRGVPLIVVLLLGAPALAGCLDDEAAPPPGPNQDPLVAVGERGPPRLVTEGGTVPLDPWLERSSKRDLPSLLRLGQVEHWTTDAGAMRLLTDGQAFVLFIDQSVAPHGAGTVVLARVYADDSGTIASGVWVVRGDEAAHVPVALVPNDIIRFGVSYRYEVTVFLPEGAFDCRCAFRSARTDAGLEVGELVETAGPEQDAEAPRPRSNGWNGTILAHHDGPLSFHPDWDLGFEGPDQGTDRPDPLERPLLGGPETGLYTFTFTGTRVWLMDVLFEFDRSRIAATEPHARGNGSSSLHIQLDGWRPLEAYVAMPPSKGLAQSFTLQVFVDYETRDDLPGEEDQRFFLTAAVGYRLGGSTYVAETDGRDLGVRVVHGL